MPSTFSPQSPRKPVWQRKNTKLLMTITKLKDYKMTYQVDYLHHRPLRIISRVFKLVVVKPILQFFLLLHQFCKFVCIDNHLQKVFSTNSILNNNNRMIP